MNEVLPILVTGATGFLGDRLARSLHDSGLQVIATGRDKSKLSFLSELGIKTYAKDLSEPFSDEEIQSIGTIGAIAHCAALSSPWGPLRDFTSANVHATANLIDLSAKHDDCRIVHISSPAVYFEPKDQLDVSEKMPLPARAVNHYARTKMQAEHLLMSQTAPSIILRPRGIYGPGDTALVPRLIRAAEQRPLPLFRGGRAVTDLTHVDDVVSAIKAALRVSHLQSTQVYNISGGEALNIKGVIESVCYYAGCDLKWRAMPTGAVMAAARCVESWSALTGYKEEPTVTRYSLGLLAWSQTLDISKAQRDLDWQPSIDFESGLRETLKALFP